MKKFVKYIYFGLFYVLDYSRSFNMHIENKKIKKIESFQKSYVELIELYGFFRLLSRANVYFLELKSTFSS